MNNSDSRASILRRYPRLVAHVIAESLGYATPTVAATIIADAREGRDNWCEWIAACHGCDPRRAVRLAVRNRHHHHGIMADYRRALALVQHAIATRQEPILASWF